MDERTKERNREFMRLVVEYGRLYYKKVKSPDPRLVPIRTDGEFVVCLNVEGNYEVRVLGKGRWRRIWLHLMKLEALRDALSQLEMVLEEGENPLF